MENYKEVLWKKKKACMIIIIKYDRKPKFLMMGILGKHDKEVE